MDFDFVCLLQPVKGHLQCVNGNELTIWRPISADDHIGVS